MSTGHLHPAATPPTVPGVSPSATPWSPPLGQPSPGPGPMPIHHPAPSAAPDAAAPPVHTLVPVPPNARATNPTIEPPNAPASPHGVQGSQANGAPQVAPHGRPQIERLLHGLSIARGSDLHLAHGETPRYRVAGALLPVAGEPPITGPETDRLLAEILTEDQKDTFHRTGDLDLAYQMDKAAGSPVTVRFRVNVFRSMGMTAAAIRLIPSQVVTLDALGVLPQVKEFARRRNGLVLFCGETGSGKTTSQAGLIDEINNTREARIITLEDPIEFVHTSKKSMISHREVGHGSDTSSFAQGLRAARRENPDVILIGEMRDHETIEAALEAAQNGHLVIATLHTNSAPDAIGRIINVFDDGQRQAQVRLTLAETLHAVVRQTLVPSPASERGRVVAQEIMMVTPGIRNNIRTGDIPAIRNALTDRHSGSISLNAHLADLFREGQISREAAEEFATSPEDLRRQLGEF